MGLQVYALQEGASADRRQAILDPCSAGASADRGSRSYMLFEATRSRKSKVFKPYVKHRAAFLLVHDSKPLGDARINFVRAPHDARERTPRRRGDCRIIGGRVETCIQIVGAAGVAARMNCQCRIFRSLPAAVVVDNLRKRRLVLARHPMHRGGRRSHTRRHRAVSLRLRPGVRLGGLRRFCAPVRCRLAIVRRHRGRIIRGRRSRRGDRAIGVSAALSSVGRGLAPDGVHLFARRDHRWPQHDYLDLVGIEPIARYSTAAIATLRRFNYHDS
jgi:hypothetical protein